MFTKKHLFFGSLFLCASISAQEKTIDTVFIFDHRLKDAEKTQQVYRLLDADIQKNATNLSETLRFQTPVYIKENGRGAAASVSFRGTTAQQTAFIWNGISVNSMFLGQGDVNNLSLFGYENIEVKSGGGSVEYGSSAIGGTVHLNNEIKFRQGFRGYFFSEFGSFETMNSGVKLSYSDEKFSTGFSFYFADSNNDYKVSEKKYLNRNGQYHNENVNISLGYKPNPANEISFQTQYFFSGQHFPIFEEAQTKTKYKSENLRSIASWKFENQRIENHLSAAYLEEIFRYFQDISMAESSGGTGKTWILKNDFVYNFSETFNLNLLLNFKNEKAEGYRTGIENPQRNSGSSAILIKHNAEKLYLEAGIKKEFLEETDAPFLYSFGGKFHLSDDFSVKFKASKNFRTPSFNDLYWQPGGNPDLKPEISHQAEITPDFRFGNIRFSVTAYFNSVQNMIRWLPSPQGIWKPENTDRVRILGIESVMSFRKKFTNNEIETNVGYSFTNSQNTETGFQLSYVPVHKAFGMVDFRHRNWGFYLQGLFNGQTFTTTNESKTNDIEPYFVLNSGINYSFLKNYKLGFKVNNITNTIYETVEYFPLPKRNFSVNLNINL